MKNQKGFISHGVGEGGFTLIELLVVIAVIGLLASVILVALNGARSKGRDAKRIADLAQISKALELYYSANNAYPAGAPCESVFFAAYPAWSSCWPTLLSPYISAMPVDPQNNANTYYWYTYILGDKITSNCSPPTYTGAPNIYVLTARLENYASSPNGCAAYFSNQTDNPSVNYMIGQQ